MATRTSSDDIISTALDEQLFNNNQKGTKIQFPVLYSSQKNNGRAKHFFLEKVICAANAKAHAQKEKMQNIENKLKWSEGSHAPFDVFR